MSDDNQDVKVGYGPRKLDPEAYKKQKAAKSLSSRGATKYGGRKASPAPPAEPPAATGGRQFNVRTPGAKDGDETDKTGDQGSTSPRGRTAPPASLPTPLVLQHTTLEQLEQALTRRPLLLDAAITAEYQRAEGPRKGAIELFMKFENARRDGPRLEVIERLTSDEPVAPPAGADDDKTDKTDKTGVGT